ncbi:tetratricopeptide repeat protein [Halioxenophilus aromaticivorans]|uniref:Sel1 repeat family protein n=1 Tax=Halioxenophilus aromaticivorans TaxID=1306992 RepID=A0AAV3U1K9_9ALTE
MTQIKNSSRFGKSFITCALTPCKLLLVAICLPALLAGCDSRQESEITPANTSVEIYQRPGQRTKIQRPLTELADEAKQYANARDTLKLAYHTPDVRPLYAKIHHLLAGERYSEALPLLKGLAEQGYTDAAFDLFIFFDPYESGPHELEDPAKAAYWLRQALDGGYVHAQSIAALLHYHGENPEFPLDWGKSAEWFFIAAEQGDPDAQSFLSRRYKRGEGVEVNPLEAYKWQRLALDRIKVSHIGIGENGVATAEFFLNSVVEEFELTPEQIKEAEQLAAKWEDSHPWAYQSRDELASYNWEAPEDYPPPQDSPPL